MKPIGYALTALALSASAAAIAFWPTPQLPPDRVRPHPVEVEEPAPQANERLQNARESEELRNLRQQVGRMYVDLQRLRNTVSDATGIPANVDTSNPLSREEEEQRWLDHVQALDRAFRDEPLKDGWAQEMTDEIRAEVSHDPLVDGLVVDVHCRSTTCKLELADADPRKSDRAIEHVIHKFSAELQNASIAHNGDLTNPKPTALYLSKARPEDSVPLVARR